ncbi:MAG: alpha-L-fucosidase [Armatimonadota bacterium]
MLARPTPEQAAWQDLEIGMFIHFAPNTWQDKEGDDLSTPLEEINPTRLDTDEWVRVAESLGAKYIVFVAKHAGGFCWWQTETTDYSVKNTPWKGGKGDVMADLALSCAKRGMKLGVYLSPADGKHGATVGGRCKTPEEQEAYNELYREQLTELLSWYGEMMEVWFDGSIVTEVGDILTQYAPNAVIFQGPHTSIRWVGNEEGIAPYPTWNAVSKADAETLNATSEHSNPDGDVWLPIECDARIRRDWFWNTTNADTLKSVDHLMGMYYGSVGHGAVLLLNNTPDTTGAIPEADARRSVEFGAEIMKRFGKSLAETNGVRDEVTLDLGKPQTIDHVITMEDITEGERVRSYVIEGMTDGKWVEICRGSAIGHKKIDRFSPVTVSMVRFRCTESAGQPIIRSLAAYNTGADAAPAVKTRQPDYIKAGEWSADEIRKSGSCVEIDLMSICKNAAQYDVVFKKTAGGGKLDVSSVKLIVDGIDASDYIRPAKDTNSFKLSITGIDRSMKLRAMIAVGGENTRVEALIRERAGARENLTI